MTEAEEDLQHNFLIGRGLGVIENAFGRLKCKYRRVQDLQNTSTINCIKIIVAA